MTHELNITKIFEKRKQTCAYTLHAESPQD